MALTGTSDFEIVSRILLYNGVFETDYHSEYPFTDDEFRVFQEARQSGNTDRIWFDDIQVNDGSPSGFIPLIQKIRSIRFNKKKLLI